MAEAGVSVQRRFAAPHDLVWALLADTNRYDRALGLSLPRYEWGDVDGRRQRVGHASQGGVAMSWVEQPYEWIEGQHLWSRRDFLSGPVNHGGLLIELTPDGDGCQAVVTIHGEPRSWVLRMVGPLLRAHLRRKLENYVEAIASVVETETPVASTDATQPAAARAQVLITAVDNETASGEHTPSDRAELDRRARRLADTPIDPAITTCIVDALASRPDEEVAQMRPFELAQLWGHDRRRVLQAFLHGTRAGLVDLNWQVNCPVCRVAAGVVSSLGDVGRDVHCDACNIRYDLDFGANVEAVFRCNRAIRDVQPAVYCVSSPSFRPHVLAQLRIEPDQTRTFTLQPGDGRLHMRTLAEHAPVELTAAPVPARLTLTLDAETLTAEPEGTSSDGTMELTVVSRSSTRNHVLIERGAWSSEAVLGSVITSHPDFIDLFATEAPAAGLELSIGNITLLFSDLTGSTALYESVGDARAFAIVQEHFRLMEQAVAAHGGAVIKTMGDAVMASFDTPTLAVEAAIAAVQQTEATHGDLDIGVKLGIHEGPCLAVRANDRLDFFGTTVNLAARLQGQAGSGELVMMEQLVEQPSIAARLGESPRRAVTARLKGISDAQRLVAVDLRPDTADGP